MRNLHRDVSEPVAAESSSADSERGLAKDTHDLRERNEAMRDRGDAMLAWYHSLPRRERKNCDPYSHNFSEIAASLPIKADRIAARPYRRAPIRFGIFLVLVGATLQMVGSWPCG
jgi:hypothetical protein